MVCQRTEITQKTLWLHAQIAENALNIVVFDHVKHDILI